MRAIISKKLNFKMYKIPIKAYTHKYIYTNNIYI
jgi:hypothetical protein